VGDLKTNNKFLLVVWALIAVFGYTVLVNFKSSVKKEDTPGNISVVEETKISQEKELVIEEAISFVESEQGTVILPSNSTTTVTTEICTPETCPPVGRFYKPGIFSRLRRR
jgi:hypothetical protein